MAASTAVWEAASARLGMLPSRCSRPARLSLQSARLFSSSSSTVIPPSTSQPPPPSTSQPPPPIDLPTPESNTSSPVSHPSSFPSRSFAAESRLWGLRVVPASLSYFTRRPTFMDDCNALEGLVQKYRSLPRLQATEAVPVLWKSLAQYRESVPEPIEPSEYRGLLSRLQKLHLIHPAVLPEEIPEILNAFKRVVSPYDSARVPRTVDSWGRALGVGYRKTSTARAWLVEGDGSVMINSKNMAEMFQLPYQRETAVWPLSITQRLERYNVWAVVEGGGLTGQSTAVAMAIAKALLIHEPGLKPYLRKAGLITRDVREVERKKPGRIKARKMPTWVKR